MKKAVYVYVAILHLGSQRSRPFIYDLNLGLEMYTTEVICNLRMYHLRCWFKCCTESAQYSTKKRKKTLGFVNHIGTYIFCIGLDIGHVG